MQQWPSNTVTRSRALPKEKNGIGHLAFPHFFASKVDCRPPPEPPKEEEVGLPVLGAIGGQALEVHWPPEEEALEKGDQGIQDQKVKIPEDFEEDSWQDSSACSPLPGDPAPLVKSKVNKGKQNSRPLIVCAGGV